MYPFHAAFRGVTMSIAGVLLGVAPSFASALTPTSFPDAAAVTRPGLAGWSALRHLPIVLCGLKTAVFSAFRRCAGVSRTSGS
jgi:hypothetical protein